MARYRRKSGRGSGLWLPMALMCVLGYFILSGTSPLEINSDTQTINPTERVYSDKVADIPEMPTTYYNDSSGDMTFGKALLIIGGCLIFVVITSTLIARIIKKIHFKKLEEKRKERIEEADRIFKDNMERVRKAKSKKTKKKAK